MLDRLQPRPGARRRPRRVGRGPGSGWNKTSGRGEKGQGKRSAGRETRIQFEGGQMPINRRLPKRGFYNPFTVRYQVVNLRDLAELADETITPAVLVERGLVSRVNAPIKILAMGDAKRAYVIQGCAVSKSAREKIEQAGGRIED